MKEIDELQAALNQAWAAIWDKHYGKGLSAEYARAAAEQVKSALALLPGLREKFKTFQARLTNEIGLRVLNEILLEEATGKSVKGDSPVPSADDLPGLLKYSMQETRATQDALGEVMQRAEAAESQLAEKDARIAAQREAILWAYQLAGVTGEPSEHLDNLSAIGRGLVPPNEWGVAGERLIVNICRIGNAIDILRPWAAMLPEYPGNLGSEKVMIIVDDVRDLAKLYAALADPESGKPE